ncbi:hypothetical protein KAM28_004486 [Salmonella enterica subsp. diarizonae serovar 47:k:z53:[z84]]|nr:hypothetical protein [Salmonella enterica subsp. diarizonae serovar 47:k:z53:[z84]]
MQARKRVVRRLCLFIFWGVSLCTLLSSAQGSILTVRQAVSKDHITLNLGAQCIINGWFGIGDWCEGIFTVPLGWQFTVSSIDHNSCFNTSFKSETPTAGRTYYGGEVIRIKVISKITSMWINSASSVCHVRVVGRLASPEGLNSSLIGSSQKVGGYTAVGLFHNYNNANRVYNSLNVRMSRWTSGMTFNELTMDVADSIALRQGEMARLLTVRNSSTGVGRVQVALSGEAASSLTTYKNGSVANCDGKVFGAGEYCEIRVAPQVPWFGKKNARANVTVTIN